MCSYSIRGKKGKDEKKADQVNEIDTCSATEHYFPTSSTPTIKMPYTQFSDSVIESHNLSKPLRKQTQLHNILPTF